jgi:SAM-dependent methyltransferase
MNLWRKKKKQTRPVLVLIGIGFVATAGACTKTGKRRKHRGGTIPPSASHSTRSGNHVKSADPRNKKGARHDPVAAQPTDHQHHRFTNPEAMAHHWNDPRRDKWQRPKKIITAMGIKKGMVVADIGAGTGYFLSFLLKAVGRKGRVIAVDIEPRMLTYLKKKKSKYGWSNLDIVLAPKGKTGLKQSSVDRILMVNTWHHVPNRIAYAAHLSERLRKNGSVWIVDFRKDAPFGPPKKYRIPPGRVAGELTAAGFKSRVHTLVLPRQYLVSGH